MVDELIRKYADEIERIIRDDTAGDYTWNGLLFSFLREVDESRTLKYEVENVESDTVRTHSVLENVKAPVETEPEKEPELLYDVIVGRDELYAHKVSYEEAQQYLREAPKWQVPRMVINQESLNDVSYYDDKKSNPEDDSAVDEENRYYDVQVYKAGWWDYIRQVSFAYAQSALKDIDGEFETKVIDHDPNRVPNWAPFRVDGHVW